MHNSTNAKLLKLAEDYSNSIDEIFGYFTNLGGGSVDQKYTDSDLDSFYQTAEDWFGEKQETPAVVPVPTPATEPATQYNLDSRSEKNIATLHSRLKPVAIIFMQKAAEAGIPIIITEGYRSNKRQQKLYDQGRTKPGMKLTNAEPGNSLHNHGLAFDVAPLENGQVNYHAQIDWDTLGKIGNSVGLFWGGNFKGFTDKPHFQLQNAWKVAKEEPYKL